jgi:UDP-2,3-diacylglucosamine hydrolase
MRSIFLADAHLRSPGDPNYRALLAFLESLQGNTSTLFILGDLFEFWMGYPEEAFPHYREALDALLALKASGTEIVYFEGNHDFHLGPFFSEKLAAKVFPGPAEVTIDGIRIHICHGDEVRANLAYSFLRGVLHSSAIRLMIRIFPPCVAFAVYRFLSRRSSGRSGSSPRGDIAGVIREYAGRRFAEGSRGVILGHFHVPLLEVSQEGAVLAVGEWMDTCSYGEFEDGVLRLRSWPDGVSSERVIPKSAR